MRTKTKHVLLVEDEEAHAELIMLSFESRTDINLTVAASLRQARDRLAESTPDLLILDSLLPDGRGMELMKDVSNGPACAVILLTSQADEAMQAEAMAAGTTLYVVKSEVTLCDMPQIADDALHRWRAEKPGPEIEA